MTSSVNTENLKAARKARKLDLIEVANFTKINLDRLRDFEAGDADPTVGQVGRLSELYNAPIFSFFSEKPLRLEPTLPDFRKPNLPSADLSPEGLARLWNSEKVAAFTDQLTSILNLKFSSTKRWMRLTNEPLPSANQLRLSFNEWRSTHAPGLRHAGSETQLTFKYLRHYIETFGCITMVNDAPTKDYLGFYKTFGRAHTTFVNKAIQNEKRQLFTLTHEFAHFLQNAEGISNPFVTVNHVERLSNRFAAEFLAPEEAILELLNDAPRYDRDDPQRLIKYISSRTLLSAQATALRLRDMRVVPASSARALFSGYAKNVDDREGKRTPTKKPMGRSVTVGRKLSELGTLVVYVAARAIDLKILDTIDVARALRISENLQPDVFDLAKRRFEATIE